jgi:hypothetical protein
MTDISEDFIDGHHHLARQGHAEKYVFPKLESEVHPGMELRDYFAAKVLPQIILQTSPYKAATQAYIYADAMIEVRKEGKK